MLTPKYLSDCPENLIELYAQLEADILSDMARKIKAYDVFSSSVNWQKDRVRLMGEVYEEILKRLSAATGKTVSELKAILQDAGIKTLAADDEIYRVAGKKITPLDASESLQSVLSVGLTKTANSFANLTKTTAKNGSRQFVETLDRAYMQVTSGAFDTNTAVRNAIKELAGQGIISIRYKNRTDSIETAVRRAVVTGVSQTCGMLQEARADEMNCDLVEVTAHAGARPSHAEWQGKIYSRSGSHPDYPSLKEATGYGTAGGLKGVNCRHDFYPFIEGISEPAYSSEELKEYKESKDYTYNGEELTEYEATQKQRYIERQLRKYKRQQQALKAADFPEDEAAAKVKHWNVVQEDFIRQTGLKRQYDRESVPQIGKKALAQFTFKRAPGAGNTTQEKMTVMSAIAHTSKNVREKMRSTTIQIGGAASAYDYQNDIMYIANGAAENEVHHEIGHLIDSKMLDAEKVMKLKKEVFKETELSDIIAKTMYETNGNPVSVLIVRNEKLVSEYQGRIYVEKFEDAFDEFGELRLDKMLEFVSEPYRAYMEEPETFKEKYASFYALLKEVVENEPER